jgi:hypothetical protein
VKVSFVLGHDSHGHPLTTANGCSGTIQTSADGGHDEDANIFGVFDAEYTDGGGGGQEALTTHDQNVVQPRHRQAEHYGKSEGVTIQTKATAHGGKTVGDINNRDWISFEPYVLSNATKITARISSGGTGGKLEVRAGSPTGRLLGTATVPVTGGWENFQDVTANLTKAPRGTTTLYLVFKGSGTGVPVRRGRLHLHNPLREVRHASNWPNSDRCCRRRPAHRVCVGAGRVEGIGLRPVGGSGPPPRRPRRVSGSWCSPRPPGSGTTRSPKGSPR